MVGGEAIGNTFPSVHLTFIAYNHRRVWGSLARRSSSPSCLQRFKKQKSKKKKNIKIFFFKKRNKDSSPGLYFRFEVGGNSMCLGLAMGPQSLAIIPSVAVWQVFVGCGFWPPREMNGTGEGLCHAPHTSGPSGGVAGPSGQASGPGSTCLSSAGQMLSLLVCSCLQIPP